MSKVKTLIVSCAAAVAAMPVAAQTQVRGLRTPGSHATRMMQKLTPSQHVAKARAFDKKYPLLCKAIQRPFSVTATTPLKSVGVTPSKNRAQVKPPMMVTADGRELYGNVVYSGFWDEDKYGLYKFNATESVDPESLWINEDCAANGGGALVDGVFHTVNYFINDDYIFINYYSFNAETGEEIESKGLEDISMIALELAVAQNGKVFGEFYNSTAEGFELGVIDYSSLTRSTIGKLNNCYVALGMTKDNTIYGVATDGNLYKIDSKTAEETLVGATGLTLTTSTNGHYQQSGEIDQKTGTFYWAAVDSEHNSALYTVDLTSGTASKVGDFTGGEMVFALTVPAPAAEDGAPAAVGQDNVAFMTSGGELSLVLIFKAPSKTFAGDELSGMLNYAIEVDGEEMGSGTVLPGVTVTKRLTVSGNGTHEFTVTTSNSVGRSPQTKIQRYIGFDQTYPVEEVKATANTTTGEVTLAWDAPTGSYNDGYVGSLKYDVVRYPDEVKVAEGISATTYTDKVSPEQLTAYTYGVTAINGDVRSDEQTSGKVVLGPALNPPYDNDFADESSLDLMTIIDSNNDGCTWGYHPEQRCAYNVYNTDNAADDWLLTPSIKMEAGKEYAVTFTASNTIEEYAERLEVKYGVGDNPTAFSGTLLPSTELTSKKEFTSYIKPDKDQDVRIGFHAISDADRFNLLLFGVHVAEGCEASAPDSVSDFKVTPDPTGDTMANISFRLPNFSIDGKALTGITKVEVLRDGKVTVSETSGHIPGQYCKYPDCPEKDSTYSYKVVVYGRNGEKGRMSLSKSAFVGTDIPQAVDGASLTVKDNKTSVDLAWDPVTVGANGGFVETKNIKYNVYDKISYDDFYGYEYGNLLGSVTGSGSLSISMNTEEGDEQNLLQPYIQPENGKGKGYFTEAKTTILTGKPYALPFSETFSNGASDGNKQWWCSVDGSSSWRLDGSVASPDGGDDGVVLFDGCGDESYLATGKINPAAADNLMLYFNIRGEFTDNVSMTVQVQKADGTVDNLKTLNFNDPENVSDWYSESVSLSRYANERYIIVRFLGNGRGYLAIDNVVVRNLYADDLGVKMSAPKSLAKGGSADVDVTVTNMGENTASGYTVKLYDGKELMDEKTVNSSLEPNVSETVTMKFNTTIFHEGDSTKLTAEVVYDKDLDLTNNKVSADVELVSSTKAAPASATKTKDGDGVKVAWTAPASTDGVVTDGFEDYATWTMDNFGAWTCIDGDKGYTGEVFTGDDVMNIGEPFAFEIFEPGAMDGLLDSDPGVAAHGGEKYATAFYSILDDNYVDADNWLISPSLSGKKQTIKFFALNQYDSENNYPETIELLYSKGGKSREDFVLVKTVTVESKAWEEVSFDVPEGATFFAIHHVTSEGGFMLGIDDVTYEGGNGVLTGYNIYCDNELVKTVSASTLEWVDSSASLASDYAVTAVYADGESVPTAALAPSGIDSAEASSAAKSFDVYTVDGKLIGRGMTSTATLPAGIYVVNGQKVTVK